MTILIHVNKLAVANDFRIVHHSVPQTTIKDIFYQINERNKVQQVHQLYVCTCQNQKQRRNANYLTKTSK